VVARRVISAITKPSAGRRIRRDVRAKARASRMRAVKYAVRLRPDSRADTVIVLQCRSGNAVTVEVIIRAIDAVVIATCIARAIMTGPTSRAAGTITGYEAAVIAVTGSAATTTTPAGSSRSSAAIIGQYWFLTNHNSGKHGKCSGSAALKKSTTTNLDCECLEEPVGHVITSLRLDIDIQSSAAVASSTAIRKPRPSFTSPFPRRIPCSSHAKQKGVIPMPNRAARLDLTSGRTWGWERKPCAQIVTSATVPWHTTIVSTSDRSSIKFANSGSSRSHGPQ
jgi:hypothetical protein